MAATATNLLSGPGALFAGDFGADEGAPGDVDTTAPEAPDWTDLGATDDGVTLTVATEWFKLRMDQAIDAPSRRPTERDITITTNLAEITLENFARVIAQDPASITTGSGFKQLDIAGDDAGEDPLFSALIFRGRSPGNHRRHVIMRKALPTGEVETAYKKGDQTFYPAEFSAHWVSPSVRPVRVLDGIAVIPG